jgi:hypothetical protein
LRQWGSHAPQSCTMPQPISSVAVTTFTCISAAAAWEDVNIPSLRRRRLFVQLDNNSRKNRQAAFMHSI